LAAVGVLVMIVVQGVVIAALLVERCRRRAAEARLLEVVHLNQSVTVGALSGSIGHARPGTISEMALASSVRCRRMLKAEFFWLLLLTITAAAGNCAAETVDRVPRVLILYPFDERIPATTIAGDSARNRLIEATAGKIDLYSEFLDLSRFPEKVHVDRMARYLAEKYTDHRPDVVVALGAEAVGFIVANRAAVAPQAKIVFAGVSAADAAKMNLPGDVVGALTEFEIAKTLEMARRLQPGAHHLVVMAGSADFDREWIATARKGLPALAQNYDTTYLTDLTIDEFVQRAAHLSPDTILLVLTVAKDSTGRNFIPRDALGEIARAASAPTYGPYSTYIGFGAVGSNTVTFEAIGTTVADLAVDALAGKPIDNAVVPQTYLADARQLKRWGLSESLLPPGTVLSFTERTLWEEHWAAIVAAVVIIALQGTIIAGLLVERRRRRAAEQELRVRLLELVHLNQSVTAGALSASIGHELNQPLSAIRSNAEAAELILLGAVPDLKLVQQILADIREDDTRASEIISRLRGLLKKRSEVPPQEFDLNEVIKSAGQILHAEAKRRGVELVFSQTPRELRVRADKVHLQQVVLNLANNAMEAMLDPNLTKRRVVFQTALTKESKVEVAIADTGHGIPSDQLERVFEPFRTSKPTGTGLGLPIARAILEAYDGKIWADNGPAGGAVFRFVLPLAQAG
jgi:signal transduction histidine kinase